jgi:hypothetical protein
MENVYRVESVVSFKIVGSAGSMKSLKASRVVSFNRVES